jgi:hypothetical protein
MRGQFLLLLLLVCWGSSYDQHDDFKWIMSYYEDNSQYPIIHAYYNHHFSSTHQFTDFLAVLEETEYRNKDHARFLLTNCDNMKRTPQTTQPDSRRSAMT